MENISILGFKVVCFVLFSLVESSFKLAVKLQERCDEKNTKHNGNCVCNHDCCGL